MAYNLSAFAGAGAQFFDDNGDPLTGGLLYVYTAGTTTPATTWTTNSGAVANTNPIVLDAAGRTPAQIWLNNGITYKFILKTSTSVLIGTYDNIPAIDDPTVFNNLITVTGTNTLLGTSVPPYTSYVAGMTLSFIPVATNTGAVTISVDGLGAKNIYVGNASPLSGGELVLGRIAQIEYDGTRFQLAVATIADGSITSAKLANAALTLPNSLNFAPAVTLASAASVAIGAAASNNIIITGTTTITSFDTIANGAVRQVTFAGALTLTHNAASLILPSSNNITTAANDVATFLSLGSGNWRCVAYQRVDGGPIRTNSKIQPITATVATNALTLTLNPTLLDFRSSTLSSGTVNNRSITTAVSVTVPNTATLGTSNAVESRLTVLAIDNAGTVELAVVNNSNATTALNLDETTLISTTAMTTGADSAGVIYSTTARTNVPYRVIGFIDITEATAGTWATAPTDIQGIGGVNATAFSRQLSQAWVNWDGTTGTIRASFNVSSVSRTGTGAYTINFTKELPDTNYVLAGVVNRWSATRPNMLAMPNTVSMLTTSVAVIDIDTADSTLRDTAYMTAAVFR
jgi:hypothetical protein